MYQTFCSPAQFGFFGNHLYEIGGKKTPINPDFTMSDGSNLETVISDTTGTVSISAKINVADFYKKETNEASYGNILEYLRENKSMDIPTINKTVKVLLDYKILDSCGCVVDEGVRVVQANMRDSIQLLDLSEDNRLSYRSSLVVSAKYIIDRFRTPSYRVSPSFVSRPRSINDSLVFCINSIRVLGSNMRCPSKTIGPSIMDSTLSRCSQTLHQMNGDSVELFDSLGWFDMNFGNHSVCSRMTTVAVDVNISIPIIDVTSTVELEDIVNINKQECYSVPGETPCFNPDIFQPVVTRPMCPGPYPHDTNHFWDNTYTCYPGHEDKPHRHPIVPGPNWKPDGLCEIDPNNIKKTDPAGLYTCSGKMKYSWKRLMDDHVFYIDNGRLYMTPPKNIEGILIIDKDVTELTPSTFFNMRGLDTLVIPDGVTVIPEYFAYMAENLRKVIIPDSVEVIEKSAFQHCSSLEFAALPTGIISVEEKTFSHGKCLNITVPETVQSVGESAFEEVMHVTYLGELDTRTWGAENYTLKPVEPEPEVPPENVDPTPTPDEGSGDNQTPDVVEPNPTPDEVETPTDPVE